MTVFPAVVFLFSMFKNIISHSTYHSSCTLSPTINNQVEKKTHVHANSITKAYNQRSFTYNRFLVSASRRRPLELHQSRLFEQYPAGPVSGQNRFLNVTLPPFRNRTNHTVFINLLWTQLWVQHTDEDLSETSTVAKIWYVSACFTVIECLHTDCSTIFSLFLVVSQFLQVVRIVDQVTSLQDMPFPPYSTVPYPIPLQTLSGHQISFSRLDTFAFSHCGFTH